MKKRYYLAYGSNLNLAQMALRCPAFYYKTSLTLPVKALRSGKVKSLPCYLYIMHEDRPMGLPTEFYLQTCLEGYRAFGFDTDILMDALEESWRLCYENEN